MSNSKCPQCGLVNFSNANTCKRCHNPLSNTPFNPPIQQAVVTNGAGISYAVSQTAKAQPSLTSIIKNDYAALVGFLIPLIGWGFYIATNVFGVSLTSRSKTNLSADNAGDLFIYFALGGTLLGVALLVWRVNAFRETFANGQEIVGRITSVSFFKDRGRVEYSYIFNQQTYQSGNAIMKNYKTESFREGDEILLIVGASNPNRAFIKDLYL